MSESSPYERFDQDQRKVEAALRKRDAARTPVGRWYQNMKARYFSAVVELDMVDIEAAEYRETHPEAAEASPQRLSENDAIRRALATPSFLEATLQGGGTILVRKPDGSIEIDRGDQPPEGTPATL